MTLIPSPRSAEPSRRSSFGICLAVLFAVCFVYNTVVLGVLYLREGDPEAAVEQFRNYIEHAPTTTNLEPVREMLAEAERLAAESAQD